MKITFILPGLNLSGGSRVVAIYADRLAARGHDVWVIAPRRKPPTLRRRIASLIKSRRWLSYAPYDDTYFRGIRAGVKILKSSDPVTDGDVPDGDIVIATWWETAEWAWSLSDTKGVKIHLVQGHEIFEYLPVQRVKTTYRLPLKKIAVSQWLVNVMNENYGVRDCTLVSNAIDLKQFFTEAKGRQISPTVGFLYSTVPVKNIALAAEAIARAKLKMPNLKVIAFGATQPTTSLPLPHGTVYYQSPAQELIREIYAGCDAWLFSSKSEGFGLPILEAMACRTPVIATPAGAAPELLAGGGGILVNPEDPQAMADAIERIFSMSDSQWRELSDNALATAQRHSWKEATDLFEKTLIGAMESR